MKKLLNVAIPTKKADFMGQKDAVEFRKLSGNEVEQFQKKLEEAKDSGGKALRVQYWLIREVVTDAADLTDEEMGQFPIDETNKLVKEVLEFSGIAANEGNS